MTPDRAGLREAARTAYRVWIEGQDRADGDGFFTAEDWEALVHAMDALDTAATGDSEGPGHPHPCEQCDATIDWWVKRALALPATPDITPEHEPYGLPYGLRGQR